MGFLDMSGVVIKVKNLTRSKAFYRDILGLGDPVMDSNFRVEFRCGEAFSLFLEKNLWEEPELCCSRSVSWFYSAGKAREIQEKMQTYGFTDSDLIVENKGGRAFCRFSDPEGNAFYVPAPEDVKN